jgi:hypothetical protein
LRSDELSGFKLRDRLVGEPDLVEFAALNQLHDDLSSRSLVARVSPIAPVFRR